MRDERLQAQYDMYAKTFSHFLCLGVGCFHIGRFNDLECSCGDLSMSDECPKCGAVTMWLTPEEHKRQTLEE